MELARRWLPPLLALLAVVTGGVLLARADNGIVTDHAVVDGVPLDVTRPAGGDRAPGVVVAHGYAGSARLMAQFGDALVARGYTVVLPDLDGHGASLRSPVDLQHDLDVAVTHLRSLPTVDPARVALVGHSMGATAVTRYAAGHPDIAATVAISLPLSDDVTPSRPAHLLLLVGQLEFPGFHDTADSALARAGSDRAAETVPGVEHISILYATRTHRLTTDWIDAAFGRTATDPALPSPLRRLVPAGLLLLGLLLGFVPLVRLLLGAPSVGSRAGGSPVGGSDGDGSLVGGSRAGGSLVGGPGADGSVVGGSLGGDSVGGLAAGRSRGGDSVGGSAAGRSRAGVGSAAGLLVRLGRIVAVAAGSAVLAAIIAPFLPTTHLELGGYAAGFLAVMGGAILVLLRLLRNFSSSPRGGWRPLVAAPILIAYAAAAIAVPLHLGFTHAVPVGTRWWLLLLVWAGLALLAYASDHLTGGSLRGDLIVSAIAVVGLTAASVLGLASGFLILVVPLLAVLMVIQSGLAAVLRASNAPPWVTALTGAILVAWPIATTLPIAI